MWVESAEDVRLRRNSPVQGWLFLAVFLVAIGGASVLYGALRHCRPVQSADHRSAAVGTFDGIDAVFFVMWAGMFQILRVHDGLRYPLTMRKAPAESLEQGAMAMTTTYFVLVGIVLVLILAARLFNPVDLDEYDRYLRKILHVSPSRKPSR